MLTWSGACATKLEHQRLLQLSCAAKSGGGPCSAAAHFAVLVLRQPHLPHQFIRPSARVPGSVKLQLPSEACAPTSMLGSRPQRASGRTHTCGVIGDNHICFGILSSCIEPCRCLQQHVLRSGVLPPHQVFCEPGHGGEVLRQRGAQAERQRRARWALPPACSIDEATTLFSRTPTKKNKLILHNGHSCIKDEAGAPADL